MWDPPTSHLMKRIGDHKTDALGSEPTRYMAPTGRDKPDENETRVTLIVIFIIVHIAEDLFRIVRWLQTGSVTLLPGSVCLLFFLLHGEIIFHHP
jgi:hypothetical protein